MSDNLDDLFQAARQAKPDTARLEFGFETRLLARLRVERAAEAPWYALAWRLAPVFAAVVFALGVWEYAAAPFATLDGALAAPATREFWMGD